MGERELAPVNVEKAAVSACQEAIDTVAQAGDEWCALVRYIVERILGRAPKPNLGLNALGTG